MTDTIMLVAAVALIGADGCVLMQRRLLGRAHGGLWEFPGGKVESGETVEAAACREIAEELGVKVLPTSLVPAGFASDPVAREDGRNSGGTAPLILLFTCREWEGEPCCLDGEEIAWYAPAALEALAMPPLDYPLAAALLRMVSETHS